MLSFCKDYAELLQSFCRNSAEFLKSLRRAYAELPKSFTRASDELLKSFCRDVAEFLGADSSEGQRHEKEHCILLAEIAAELDVCHVLTGLFGLECEIRGL